MSVSIGPCQNGPGGSRIHPVYNSYYSPIAQQNVGGIADTVTKTVAKLWLENQGPLSLACGSHGVTDRLPTVDRFTVEMPDLHAKLPGHAEAPRGGWLQPFRETPDNVRYLEHMACCLRLGTKMALLAAPGASPPETLGRLLADLCDTPTVIVDLKQIQNPETLKNALWAARAVWGELLMKNYGQASPEVRKAVTDLPDDRKAHVMVLATGSEVPAGFEKINGPASPALLEAVNNLDTHNLLPPPWAP